MSSFKHHVAVNATLAGDNVLIPASPSSEFIITSGMLICSGGSSFVFQSGTDGDDLSGPLFLGAGHQIFPLPDHPSGHFKVARGQSLNLRGFGETNVSGWLNYTEVIS